MTDRLLYLALAAALIAPAAVAASSTEVGRPVAQVLREAESAGIRVIFTDQSVPPGLRVSVDSHASEPVEHLRDILRPHRLALQEVTSGVYVVAPATAPATSPARGPPDQSDALREIEVTASRYTLDSLFADAFHMQAVDLQKQPANFNDAARSIRRFPGTAGQDLSSRTFVRGGTPDDNLILLDGVPLYEPFHLPGLPINFSAIDSSLVSGLDFYSGVLPQEYTGRMGGLMNLHLPEVDDMPRARVSLGSLAASALASGPAFGSNGDWMLSARKGLLGRFVQVTDPPLGHPNMLDALGRARYRFDNGNTLTVGALAIQDSVNMTDDIFLDDSYSRRYAWAVYERARDRVGSRTTLSYTALKSMRIGSVYNTFDSTTSLLDSRDLRGITLRQAWTLPLDGGALQWGGSLNVETAEFSLDRYRRYQSDVAGFFGLEPLEQTLLLRNVSAGRGDAFADISHSLGEHLTFDAGLSWSGAHYSTEQNAHAFDPRASLRWDVTPSTRVRASWGRMTQQWTAAELPVERNVLRFDDPSRNTMRVLALEQDFGSWLSVRAEAFDKRIARPRPRVENVFYPYAFLTELRPDVRVIAPVSSKMRGYDLYATARFSEHWSGWLSYSRSKAFDVFIDRTAPRAWDQPHAAGIGVAATTNTWLLSAEILGHSNWPITPLQSYIIQDGADQMIRRAEGGTYSVRQGVFLSLNLKAARRFETSFGMLSLAYEVSNATDRNNWCCSDLVFFQDASTNGVDETTARKRWLPRTQFATVTWEFGGRGTR
jgi:hypothetical protein